MTVTHQKRKHESYEANRKLKFSFCHMRTIMEFFLKDYFRKQEMDHKIIYTKLGGGGVEKFPQAVNLIWKPIFIAQLKTAKSRHLYNRNADMTLIPEVQRV